MIEHGTPEWVQARLGKLTASRVHDALATKKDGGWYATRRHYMIELVAERLTGMQAGPFGVDATFVPASMQWGQETEPQAVSAYERGRGVKVEPAGFVAHPLLAMAGASPDGLVGDDGMIQVKCPESRTHAATLIERTVPPEYEMQMLWEMACCPTRQWSDYLSFDPRMPPKLRAAVIRVPRDNKKIASLTIMAEDFLCEIDEIMKALESGVVRLPEWKMTGPATIKTVPAIEHVGSEDIAATLTGKPKLRGRR